MPVELPLEKLSEDTLIEVYKSFCKAYDIGFNESDEIILRKCGLDLLKNSKLEYIITINAKFIGEITNNSKVRFYGYTQLKDPYNEQKDKKFQEEYFSKKI